MFKLEDLPKDLRPDSSFEQIKTFKDACTALNIDYNKAIRMVSNIRKISHASAAMFKLNIVRKALHLNTPIRWGGKYSNPGLAYPYFMFCHLERMNKIVHKGEFICYFRIGIHRILGLPYALYLNEVNYARGAGLGCIRRDGDGDTDANMGYLGCANREIALHFGKYFGHLIAESMYGDVVEFHKDTPEEIFKK